MKQEKRPVVIAGNWKMNKTPSETKSLLNEMIPLIKDKSCEVIVCVPFIDLMEAVNLTKGTNIKIGAQNCHFKASGAYTGEISPAMLKNIGIEYVIIGHSERRAYFNETDISVNQKVNKALKEGLKVIVCVGESLEQREDNITENVISMQTYAALIGLQKEDLKNIIIAYEPVWAIGTGKTATANQADEACKIIRSVVLKQYGQETADNLTIQYGGSMNANNAEELLAKENINGGLIGGASLKADNFAKIVEIASI